MPTMKNILAKFYVIVAVALLLHGCATPGHVQPPRSLAPPDAAALVVWQWDGRMVLHHDGKAWRAGVLWQQDQNDYKISLQSWLGQQLAQLQTEQGAVVLSRPQQPPMMADSAAALLAEVFGGRYLPVDGLSHWLLGQPVPQLISASQHDRYGRIQWLEQQGWRIDYDRFHEIDGYWLPAKLRLERSGVKVRIVIDHWSIGQES